MSHSIGISYESMVIRDTETPGFPLYAVHILLLLMTGLMTGLTAVAIYKNSLRSFAVKLSGEGSCTMLGYKECPQRVTATAS